MNHNPNTIVRNRHAVERFLSGTHSKCIDDVDVIDDTVGPNITCHGFPGQPITDHESYKDFFRDFAGIEADGRRITFDGMVLYRMEDGLIVETWLHINEMRLMREIGALPAIAA